MSRIETLFRPKANSYEGRAFRWAMNQAQRHRSPVFAGLLMLAAPLSGCIGEGERLRKWT